MASLQQYALPILATAGAIFFAKKIFDFTHNHHTVIDSYKTQEDLKNVVIPQEFPNYFKTNSGIILHSRRYLVPASNCIGVVFFLHGFTEHSGRYEGLAYDLNKLGYTVCLLDHVGHGGSQGDRSFCVNFLEYVKGAIEWINIEYDNMLNSRAGWSVPGFTLDQSFVTGTISKNVVISAHSMGGLVASRLGLYIKENPTAIPWITTPPRFVLSAPGLALDKKLTDLPILLKISQLLSTFVPKMVVQTMPDVELSLNPNITIIAKRDPLINGPEVMARFGAEFINTIEYCQNNAKNFDFPLLIMQSDADNIVNSSGSKQFYANVTTIGDQKEYISCQGLHEILFDIDRPMLIKAIGTFLEKNQSK